MNDSAALTGILFVLKTGIPWEMLPQEMGCGPGMTCWRRLEEWHKAGVWERLYRALLDRLGEAGRIDWSRASLDSASVAAPGGEKTGPNPTDRGKSGSKRHVLVDRSGVPLAVKHSAANVHDSRMLETMLDAVSPIRRPRGRPGRPRKRPEKLHADKAYDFDRCREALRKAGHCPAHRSARAPLKRTLGTLPVGGRTDTGVAQLLQEAEGVLCEAGRRAPGFPSLGCALVR